MSVAPGTMNRAYAVLEVKASATSDGERTISGWATTPTPDRSNDTINPMGVKFANPLPLLWMHNSDEPIGTAIFGKATAKGIPFTATIATFEDPPGLKARVDEAWNSIRAKLVRGVSIGFKALKYSYLDNGGVEYDETEVVELSVVTIPCNSEATIQTIKSFDTKQGASAHRVTRITPAGVTAKTATGIVRLATTTPPEGTMNIQKQIESYTAARQAKAAVIAGILAKSEESGESFSKEQETEYEDARAEITTIDKHLSRLNDAAQLMLPASNRLTVVEGAGGDAQKAAERIVSGGNHVVGNRVVAVEQKLDKGIGFARFVKLMAMGEGSAREALSIAQERYPNENPLHDILKMHIGQGKSTAFIEKAAVAGAITSNSAWAGALVQYQDMANDFIEFLRPQTLIGQINGFRRVPFKVRVPRQTGGGTASWVGEGKAKPLTSLAFDNVTLDFTKIATIAVLTDEIIRLSSPAADALTRDQLAKAIIQQMDSDFIDPANAGSANVKPASITNGVTPVVSTGTNTQAGVALDIMNLVAPWITSNMDPRLGVFIMTPTTAMSLGLMTNSLGNKVFPGITINGGTLEGWPVVVSNAAGLVGASDGSHIVVLMNPSDILLADDGTVAVDASRETSLEMSDAPASNSGSPTGASLVSMFQTNSVAIRAERWINWVKGRTTSVQYLSGVHWGGFPS